MLLPLTNDVIIGLNEITTMVADKEKLSESETQLVKTIFGNILKKGDSYDVSDIESWFENEGSWHNRSTRVRITNLAHYVQSKHEQTTQLRMVNDGCTDDSCGCDH